MGEELDDFSEFEDDDDGACPDCGASSGDECDEDCPSRDEDEDA